MILQKSIDKILEKCNIVEVAGDYLELKKAGANFKACCCFHDEKNPTLTFFPRTDTFKCFACGAHGNSVGFVMRHENLSYPEALKVLAKKYDVEIEERQLTDEEQQEYMTLEAMRIANKNLAEEYERQMDRYPKAKAYAYNRWGEKFCKLMGIGYCPMYAKLISSVGISDEIANDLHLRNKGGYDFFQGRITIPIRDRQQNVIGFTAREFDSGSDAKYMNSSDSPIYNKSKSVFGINLAWREAAKTERLYMVEGAPDCMRLQSIGILNTVAPLGTAWTTDNLNLLKRAVSQVCFLPDADPPKAGQDYGPGIAAVMKSGKLAMQVGFVVSVKQIPVTEEKQDPDTYCTSKAIFDDIEEEDFVIWYAHLLFKDGMTTDKKSKVVNEVASLLMLVKDETALDMYLTQVSKIDGTKAIWRKAIENQRKKKEDDEVKAQHDKDETLLEEYGFNVKNNCYFSILNGSFFEWSNFIMEPLFHIKDAVNPKRLYVLKNSDNVEELIELKQEDLVSLQRFKLRTEGMGNFIWNAKEPELNRLKRYLYKKTESAVEITQLGWQRQGFFAFGNGIYYGGQFIRVSDYGIVRLGEKGNYYLPSHSKIYRDETKLFAFERLFVHKGLSNISLTDYTRQMFKVFGDNGKVGFCFYLATLFRDIVLKDAEKFPILNLFGPKGSGKSELGHTLMSFFVIKNTPPNLVNATIPALNETIAAVSNALVHLDEFKNDIDLSKRELLKGLWDGTGRTRMNMDLDKKKETTSVDSGVIVSGQEMATADNALFSRLIFLTFTKCEFTPEEKENYQNLMRMRQLGMSHLTLYLLNFREKVEDSFHTMYHETFSDLMRIFRDVPIEDRILLNWLIPLATFRCLETSIDVPITYKDMFDVCVEGIRRQNAECKQNNELAAFWNMVQFLVSDGELMENGDFKIQYTRRFKSDVIKAETEWIETRPVLYIQKSRIFMLYKKYGKAVGDSILPEGSLKYYLEHSKAYLGEKAMRFHVFYKGVVQYEDGRKTSTGNLIKKQTHQRSLCFDYSELVKTYDINLEKVKVEDVKEDNVNQDEDENENSQTTIDFPP